MPIDTLTVENFKGIKERQVFTIKPITLLIGANSSGKSSCIHALAALAQTVKLAASNRAIVLDDEYAQVHLGRFIEVIHSKSYSDSMKIGFSMEKAGRNVAYEKGKFILDKDKPINIEHSFKSTKRTQDVTIEQAIFESNGSKLKVDKKAKIYSAEFNGSKVEAQINTRGLRLRFLPQQSASKNRASFFESFVFSEASNDLISEELRKVFYLGPFRQSPLRRYPTKGAAPTEVGAQGEMAITLLANEYVQQKNRPNISQIGRWLQEIGLARSIDIARIGKSDLFDLNVTLPDGANLPMADLGYGVSQVLPVLAQCSYAPKGATLLFEQPELHLHPAAAKKLGTVFAEVTKKKGLRIVAETHSRELFHQILQEIREGNLSLNDVCAYTVERKNGCSVFKSIEIEQDGEHISVYDPWDACLIQK
ncbi:MAG: AAA family ATPase [Stagnimonas sp.]|nr:AAA family ATPase [Stagnimonas sp.]